MIEPHRMYLARTIDGDVLPASVTWAFPTGNNCRRPKCAAAIGRASRQNRSAGAVPGRPDDDDFRRRGASTADGDAWRLLAVDVGIARRRVHTNRCGERRAAVTANRGIDVGGPRRQRSRPDRSDKWAAG